jgi:hypothetical protein
MPTSRRYHSASPARITDRVLHTRMYLENATAKLSVSHRMAVLSSLLKRVLPAEVWSGLGIEGTRPARAVAET